MYGQKEELALSCQPIDWAYGVIGLRADHTPMRIFLPQL